MKRERFFNENYDLEYKLVLAFYWNDKRHMVWKCLQSSSNMNMKVLGATHKVCQRKNEILVFPFVSQDNCIFLTKRKKNLL